MIITYTGMYSVRHLAELKLNQKRRGEYFQLPVADYKNDK